MVAAVKNVNSNPGSKTVFAAPAVDPATLTDSGFFLPLSELVIDPTLQMRRDREPETIEAIKGSMRDRLTAGQHPQETPVWVVRRGNQWVLLAGFTRHEILTALAKEKDTVGPTAQNGTAANAAGALAWMMRPTIWCVAKSAPNQYRALIENYRENMDRQALSVADQAEAYAAMAKQDPTRTIADIAKDVRRAPSTVENMIRAHRDTSPEIWGAFRRHAITHKQVMKLAATKDREQQKAEFDALLNPEKKATGEKSPAGKKAGKGEPAPVADGGVAVRALELEGRVKNWNGSEYACAARDLLFYLATGDDSVRTRILEKSGDPGALNQKKREAERKRGKKATLASKAPTKKAPAKKAAAKRPTLARKAPASKRKGR